MTGGGGKMGVRETVEVRETRIAVRDGLRLRVELRGDVRGGPPPLLLLHGFTGSVEAWGEHLLASLALRHPLVAVDLPGHGGSDVPEEVDRYGMERVLGDVCDLLDRLELPEAVWVGYSMGGRLALGGAVLHPERVRALVLESASPGLAEKEDREERRLRDEELARRILADGIEAFVNEWLTLPLFRTQEILPEQVREEGRRRRLRCDPRGLVGSLLGMGTGVQPSFWDRLDGVGVPTLLLTGRLDEKFEEIARRMAGRMPRAVHRSVAEAGHTVHLERPEAWLDEILSFLATEGDVG